jgi:hypothetical protein
MDLIIINLVLIPYKFGANASNLVLMLKKIGGKGHYNFIFFINYILRKIERTQKKSLTFFFLEFGPLLRF